MNVRSPERRSAFCYRDVFFYRSLSRRSCVCISGVARRSSQCLGVTTLERTSCDSVGSRLFPVAEHDESAPRRVHRVSTSVVHPSLAPYLSTVYNAITHDVSVLSLPSALTHSVKPVCYTVPILLLTLVWTYLSVITRSIVFPRVHFGDPTYHSPRLQGAW
ncbi:hypothetical protein CONPUDRAFT_93907 [Coniophora puteana RWD-64-598 SS2]|uniref:Uncharacterized protein n=1 Tax=Coniophora puteana (strain RWD-64-598) TaxID=741705 RepID=R7SDY8_CONPW|nr:uncharacterized protein CONPUDRAFT_93907 [Coniophora puteana RWD-64-598 SS2]EIW74386.1 hypothetical protein CONPUDRAFT_93907 [Coniophora puteana RWD-64-598 SS2]